MSRIPTQTTITASPPLKQSSEHKPLVRADDLLAQRFQASLASIAPEHTTLDADAQPTTARAPHEPPAIKRRHEEGDVPTGIAAKGVAEALTHTRPSAATSDSSPTHDAATALIERATSLLVDSAARPDQARVHVALDHVLAHGTSAELVRDGAFLHVRLHARTEAALRLMWTRRDELATALATASGLVARVEIVEGERDGRIA